MYNLAYDYSSFMALLILLFFYLITPKYKSFQNRLYGWVVVVGLIACAADISSAKLILHYPDHIWINRFALSLFNLCIQSLPLCYIVYIGTLVYRGQEKNHKVAMWVLTVPGALNFVVNLISPFVPWVYSYTAEYGYQRTNWYVVQVAMSVFYMVAAIVLIVKYAERTAYISRISVIIYTVVTVIFSMIQYYHPEQLLLCSASAIAIFAMYMALQNPSLLKEALEDAERSRKEAEEANEAKSIFLANMSHEIRTPLNAICGMSYLLKKTELKPDAAEYVDTIQNAGENLKALIDQILDYTETDTGKLVLTESEYRLDRVVREALSVVLPSIDKDKVSVNAYIDASAPMVARGDVHKVKQIITCLLSNAAKFTEKGKIGLEVSGKNRDGDKFELVIKIEDTGIGIKKEDMDKLFASFEQVDMSYSRKREGAGLGLSLAKRFAEMMGGGIAVESTFGEGSLFTASFTQGFVEAFPENYRRDVAVSLTTSLDRAAEEAALKREEREVTLKPETKIALVDDNKVNLKVTSAILKKFGVVPDMYLSGFEIIKAVEEGRKYDLIFMDHMMPEMDGCETTEKLREYKKEGYDRLPIVALTANAVSGAEEIFKAAGMNDALFKPINIEELKRVLRTWLPDCINEA